MINTTENLRREPPKGVVEAVEDDETHARRVNTSDIYELPPQGTMIDADESEAEILQVLPAGNWCAVLRGVDGKITIPLAVWVAMDTGEMYGVAPRSGEKNIDLTRNVSEDPQFQTYQLVKGDR